MTFLITQDVLQQDEEKDVKQQFPIKLDYSKLKQLSGRQVHNFVIDLIVLKIWLHLLKVQIN